MARLVMETINFRPEQLAAMRARKKRTRIPVSEQVRTAVDEYLEWRAAQEAETGGPLPKARAS
jgi:Ribbon-helix-helix domain